MAIKLHYHPLSTYSRRVPIALIEKQIPHELVLVDLVARKRDKGVLSVGEWWRRPYGRQYADALTEGRLWP